METRRLVKCNHSRKTAAFIRACAAYSFITIPSLENKLSALNLYLLSGRVAIANGALSQGKQSETFYQFITSFTMYNFIYNTDYNIVYSRNPHLANYPHVRTCSQLSKTGMCPIVIIIQRTYTTHIRSIGDAFFKAAINAMKDVPQYMGKPLLIPVRMYVEITFTEH